MTDNKNRTLDFFYALPKPLRKTIVEHMKDLRPQRKTDIWYEDEKNEIWIACKGAIFTLPADCSIIWKQLGHGTSVEDIAISIVDKYEKTNIAKIYEFVASFLIEAHVLDIVILYPEDFSNENLSLLPLCKMVDI